MINFDTRFTQETFLYNYFKIHPLVKKEKSFKGFFLIFCSGGHFVQQSGTVLAILVEGYPRNIPVKLFQNLSIGLAEVLCVCVCVYSNSRNDVLRVAQQ